LKGKGEGEMTESDPSNQIDFDAPATFLKWPSLNGQRRVDSNGPYSLLNGTLDECIRQFLAKPTVTRHLEIHTSPQAPFVSAIVNAESVAELAHLRDFLVRATAALNSSASENQGSQGQ
jgi:hypothetical protein